MTLQEIQERFSDNAIQVGGTIWLPPKEALEYLTECTSYGFQLEGIEGFIITETGAYQPSQDYSNDFADVNYSRDKFIEETKSFILERAQEKILFEVVFSDKKRHPPSNY